MLVEYTFGKDELARQAAFFMLPIAMQNCIDDYMTEYSLRIHALEAEFGGPGYVPQIFVALLCEQMQRDFPDIDEAFRVQSELQSRILASGRDN